MAKKILVIDDSVSMRQAILACLTQSGFEVLEAADGAEALTKADQASLAICDVNMPVMNGIEFVKEMASRGSKVPIVMLTTEGRPELVAAARSAGAKGWLVKPFNSEQLVKVVRKLAV
jgi:two-component system chemotaxis response regulator CheY